MRDKELLQAIARQVDMSAEEVQQVVQAWQDGIVASLKRCESVTLRNFGTFYIRRGEGRTRVFKFNPSQRLRKLFGWTSTYKGKV